MSFWCYRPSLAARSDPGVARARVGLFLVAAVLATLTGCDQDEVQHYKVPKPPSFRLLGTIIPHDDQLWFLKVSGLVEEIKKHEQEVTDFYRSVRFEKDAVQWTKPQAWKEEPGKGMRKATFRFGPEDEPLELTVIAFPRAKEMSLEDAVEANVSRWRKQMGLLALSSTKDLEKAAPKAEGGGLVRYAVDVIGSRPGKTRMGPMTAMGDEEPVSPRAEALPPEVQKPTFAIPADWEEVPVQGAGAIQSVAKFRVGSGASMAVINIMSLMGPKAADPRDNADRWCDQLYRPHLSQKELSGHLSDLQVGDSTATVVDLRGRTPDEPGILGCLITRGGITWAVKMRGPTDTLDKQIEKFKDFVRLAHFP
jgi:hypothetical protein